jgi:hypothetical protein
MPDSRAETPEAVAQPVANGTLSRRAAEAAAAAAAAAAAPDAEEGEVGLREHPAPAVARMHLTHDQLQCTLHETQRQH